VLIIGGEQGVINDGLWTADVVSEIDLFDDLLHLMTGKRFAV